MLHKLLKWARVTKAAPAEAQQFAVQQVTYSGKVGDAILVMPYGVHANLPVDSLALMFAVNGEPDNRAIIGFDPKQRPELVEGEVAFYHPPTGSFIKWTEAGDLDIQVGEESGGNVTINCATATITASSSVTIDTPTTTLTGAVQVDGDLTVTGATALGATVTSSGVDISNTHTHTGSPTAPTGAISPTGVPV